MVVLGESCDLNSERKRGEVSGNLQLNTLVLNADYRPLIVVRWQRAFVMVFEGRATEVESYECFAKDGKGRQYTVPAVIAMHKFVSHNRLKVPCKRRNILIRDNYTCQYCGRTAQHLTLDHVVPKSRWNGDGSPSNWANLVTACRPCNEKKANLTCSEAAMWPINKPIAPQYGPRYIGVSTDRSIPHFWLKYME